jgi:hypothetical protein
MACNALQRFATSIDWIVIIVLRLLVLSEMSWRLSLSLFDSRNRKRQKGDSAATRFLNSGPGQSGGDFGYSFSVESGGF